ncbi:MAG: hypothetical protein PVH41_11575 [Anaerolineae bacterium]|jgi:hypothetical protein
MGFLNKITSSLFGGAMRQGEAHWEYVRCSQCGERIPVRVDLRHELTPRYGEAEGAYFVRKGVIGSGDMRCFQTIDIKLTFDAQKRLVSREIHGGAFISKEEFDDGMRVPEG